LNQHLSKDLNTSTPARVKGVDPVPADSGMGGLLKLKDRYAQWGKCKCPKKFQENYRPYHTDYTENQCLICGNLSGRKYD